MRVNVGESRGDINSIPSIEGDSVSVNEAATSGIGSVVNAVAAVARSRLFICRKTDKVRYYGGLPRAAHLEPVTGEAVYGQVLHIDA